MRQWALKTEASILNFTDCHLHLCYRILVTTQFKVCKTQHERAIHLFIQLSIHTQRGVGVLSFSYEHKAFVTVIYILSFFTMLTLLVLPH